MGRKFALGDIVTSSDDRAGFWFTGRRTRVVRIGHSVLNNGTMKYWLAVEEAEGGTKRQSAAYFEERFEFYEKLDGSASITQGYDEYQEIMATQELLCPESSK